MGCLMPRLVLSGTTKPFLGSTPGLKGVRVLPFGEGREKTLSSVRVGLFFSYWVLALESNQISCNFSDISVLQLCHENAPSPPDDDCFGSIPLLRPEHEWY